MPCFRRAALWALLPVLCTAAMSPSAQAAQVDSDQVYCFMGSDFTPESNQLTGIYISALPDQSAGTVQLSDRMLRPGDVLTAAQLETMTFHPAPTQTDISAKLSYMPIFTDRVEPETVMTISIHGKEDKPPVAEDCSMETYKNLPNSTRLKVSDPEKQPLTYTLVRAPKRGSVEFQQDGSVLYTPKHNKVGTDSFTYTACDPAGNVSREATVTVRILKPTDAQQYTDTAGLSCRFSAEWLRSTGLFSGEIINGQACFCPDEPVNRGQFLSMLMEVLDLPIERSVSSTGFIDDAPNWLKPYLAAALRSGLITGCPTPDGVEFRPDEPITAGDAREMMNSALHFSVPTVSDSDGLAARWAEQAQAAIDGSEFPFPEAECILTRGDTSEILYKLSQLKGNNPGISMIFN